jgi:hypothetical protein
VGVLSLPKVTVSSLPEKSVSEASSGPRRIWYCVPAVSSWLGKDTVEVPTAHSTRVSALQVRSSIAYVEAPMGFAIRKLYEPEVGGVNSMTWTSWEPL